MTILAKRPVAFRYKDSSDRWSYTEDESLANDAINMGHDSQALYVRDGTPIMAEWQPIDTAPTGDDDFFLVCCNDPIDDRSPFVVRGSILKGALKSGTPSHLSLGHLTHWHPLPAKPSQRNDCNNS